jgi:hypothetical protein
MFIAAVMINAAAKPARPAVFAGAVLPAGSATEKILIQ